MKQPTKFIFDLDGTLYPFVAGKHVGFSDTTFYTDLRKRIEGFVATELNINDANARRILDEIDVKFNGELSIGFEQTYGIDRYRYYDATWSCSPGDYISKDALLPKKLAELRGSVLLLTAAPRSWATGVLEHLGVSDIFADNLITGEPDIRKPDPRVFAQAAKMLNVHPRQIVSIGDQNHTDVLPAKSLGMTTILIGPERLNADQNVKDIHEAINVIKENFL